MSIKIIIYLFYFEAGVRLAESNTVTLWLEEAGVLPSDTETYKTSDVWDAVMKGNGGFRPQIECLNINGQAYITEVRALQSCFEEFPFPKQIIYFR